MIAYLLSKYCQADQRLSIAINFTQGGYIKLFIVRLIVKKEPSQYARFYPQTGPQ